MEKLGLLYNYKGALCQEINYYYEDKADFLTAYNDYNEVIYKGYWDGFEKFIADIRNNVFA